MKIENIGSSRPHRIWWQLFLLSAASTLSVYGGLSLSEVWDSIMPELVEMPSVFNKKTSGLSALFEIAKKAGLECQSWGAPYRQLSKVRGILFIAHPLKSLSDREIEQILNWVRSGNQLIYFDRFSRSNAQHLLKSLGLKRKLGRPVFDQSFQPCFAAPEFLFVKSLLVSGNERLIGGQILLADSDGAFLTELKYGKGRALIGSVSDFCANRSLCLKASFDNYQFIVNWLSTAGSSGYVMFDERCHGYSSSQNLFGFLLSRTPGLIFVQLILIFILAVASQLQRFGQIRKLGSKREISSLQFIEGLASAYERAGANLAALEIIVQDFKVGLTKKLAISPHSMIPEIASSWRSQTGASSSNLERFLADYELYIAQNKISTADLKRSIVRCNELAKEANNISHRELTS